MKKEMVALLHKWGFNDAAANIDDWWPHKNEKLCRSLLESMRRFKGFGNVDTKAIRSVRHVVHRRMGGSLRRRLVRAG